MKTAENLCSDIEKSEETSFGLFYTQRMEVLYIENSEKSEESSFGFFYEEWIFRSLKRAEKLSTDIAKSEETSF